MEENRITKIEEGIMCNELWDINNGVTLCKVCHKNLDKKVETYADKSDGFATT